MQVTLFFLFGNFSSIKKYFGPRNTGSGRVRSGEKANLTSKTLVRLGAV